MPFEIEFSDDALADYKRLDASWQSAIRSALETHLRHEPTRVSKSRIKRLRDIDHPEYRLRVDDMRVFYDVREASVEILGIVPKRQADEWLDQFTEESS